jgi:hypothetical protein
VPLGLSVVPQILKSTWAEDYDKPQELSSLAFEKQVRLKVLHEPCPSEDGGFKLPIP